MEQNKKYNLLTAISMVVGIVIGSGVFFKASVVLEATKGNLILGILAWIIGGLVMIFSAYAFSIIAARAKVNGDIGQYMEEYCGKKAGYLTGFYMSAIYYPSLAGVLAWVAARYTCVLFGVDNPLMSLTTIILAFVYVCCVFIMNFISPKIAGYFQISAAAVKLVPLVFMAVVGVIFGLFFNDDMLLENLTDTSVVPTSAGILTAICATSFAFEGWICATSISKELKNAKRNMPKALVIGTAIVLCVYLTYYIGLAGTFPNNDFVTGGDNQVMQAFSLLLGKVGGTVLYTFVVVSCLGTLNGLMMATTRGFAALSKKGFKIAPEKLGNHNRSGVSVPSALIGFVLAIFWLIVWLVGFNSLLNGGFFVDISELVIVFLYASYIPIYLMMYKKIKDGNFFNRYIVPALGIISAIVMLVACVASHKWNCLIFIGVVIVIEAIGFLLYDKTKHKDEIVEEEVVECEL